MSVFVLPAIVFGQTTGSTIISLGNFLNNLIPFIIGLAVFIFIVGLLRYVNAGGDEEKLKAARNTIIWGLIIIFVMFSAVGLVNLIVNTVGLDNTLNTRGPNGPQINF